LLQPDFSAFARALADPDAPLPAGLATIPDAPVRERFAVYRNNVHMGLVAALEERFPICRALVGEEFFRAMARIFVVQQLPTSPVLLDYGDELPAFIASFAPAATVPYLADMARLEVLWTQAWSAAEAPALPAPALATLPPEQLLGSTLSVHPASRLLCSEHPVASLWQAHQAATVDLSRITWQPECVLLTRPGAQLHLRQLTAGAAAFATALAAGLAIGAAAITTLQTHPAFDLGTTLAGLADDGFLSGINP
jgi:hypothetical protein